jgi:hypothetical protein
VAAFFAGMTTLFGFVTIIAHQDYNLGFSVLAIPDFLPRGS